MNSICNINPNREIDASEVSYSAGGGGNSSVSDELSKINICIGKKDDYCIEVAQNINTEKEFAESAIIQALNWISSYGNYVTISISVIWHGHDYYHLTGAKYFITTGDVFVGSINNAFATYNFRYVTSTSTIDISKISGTPM